MIPSKMMTTSSIPSLPPVNVNSNGLKPLFSERLPLVAVSVIFSRFVPSQTSASATEIAFPFAALKTSVVSSRVDWTPGPGTVFTGGSLIPSVTSRLNCVVPSGRFGARKLPARSRMPITPSLSTLELSLSTMIRYLRSNGNVVTARKITSFVVEL